MGIISPCGTGPSPVYADSGFLLGADYWRLGAMFGGYNSCWSACRSCFF
jgi:L-tartrate/succinate antiporter